MKKDRFLKFQIYEGKKNDDNISNFSSIDYGVINDPYIKTIKIAGCNSIFNCRCLNWTVCSRSFEYTGSWFYIDQRC